MNRPQADRAPLRRLAWVLVSLALPGILLARSLLVVLGRPSAVPEPVRWGWLAALGGALALALAAGVVEGLAARRGRRRGPAGVLPVRLLVLLVAAWLGSILTQSRTFAAWRVDVALAAALAAQALLVLADPAIAALPARWRRVLWIGALQAASVLVLTEVGLRMAGRATGLHVLDTDELLAPEVLRRERLEPFASFHHWNLNSRGFQDEEFGPRRPGLARVVMIGDSFGLGVVPHPQHYSSVAERALGDVEFLNLGVPRIGPFEYLELLRGEGLGLLPDLVLVTFFVGNDVLDANRRDGMQSLTRRVFDCGNCLVLEVPRRLWKLRGQQLPTIGEPGASAALPTPEEALERMPYLADPLLEPPRFSESTFADIEATRLAYLEDIGPELYERALQPILAMRDLAGPVPLVVVLLPDEYQVEEDVWRRALAELGRATCDRDRPQRLLTRLCEEAGLPVLDVLPALRAVEPMADGRRHVYHLRDTHLNARGNAVVGEELARLARGLLAD